jgi:hypothetical protein
VVSPPAGLLISKKCSNPEEIKVIHINNLGGINAIGLDGLTKPARDEFLRLINAAHKDVLTAESTALDSAIIAGNWLHSVKDRINIPMADWVARYLPRIGVSTYKMYLQLTAPKNLAVITAARETNPNLSITAARKLLVKKKPPAEKPAANKPEQPETAVLSISDEQLIAALVERGPDWFVANIPSTWRVWLQDYLRGQVLRVEAAKHPNVRLKNALRLVHSVDQPTTHH